MSTAPITRTRITPEPDHPLTTYSVSTYDRATGGTLSPALFGRRDLALKRFRELVTEEPQNMHSVDRRSPVGTSTIDLHMP